MNRRLGLFSFWNKSSSNNRGLELNSPTEHINQVQVKIMISKKNPGDILTERGQSLAPRVRRCVDECLLILYHVMPDQEAMLTSCAKVMTLLVLLGL